MQRTDIFRWLGKATKIPLNSNEFKPFNTRNNKKIIFYQMLIITFILISKIRKK